MENTDKLSDNMLALQKHTRKRRKNRPLFNGILTVSLYTSIASTVISLCLFGIVATRFVEAPPPITHALKNSAYITYSPKLIMVNYIAMNARKYPKFLSPFGAYSIKRDIRWLQGHPNEWYKAKPYVILPHEMIPANRMRYLAQVEHAEGFSHMSAVKTYLRKRTEVMRNVQFTVILHWAGFSVMGVAIIWALIAVLVKGPQKELKQLRSEIAKDYDKRKKAMYDWLFSEI